MENTSSSSSSEKMYWLQILISISFGIAAYFILESIFPYGVPDIVFLHIAGLWIVSGIFFLLVIGIPSSILIFKYGEKLMQSIRTSLSSFGTQLSIFILVAGFTYLVNM
ncbi:MAG: hypothetical protein ACTSQI_04870 [Candidatus Helarchaeota archaeon]